MEGPARTDVLKNFEVLGGFGEEEGLEVAVELGDEGLDSAGAVEAVCLRGGGEDLDEGGGGEEGGEEGGGGVEVAGDEFEFGRGVSGDEVDEGLSDGFIFS